MKNTEEKAIQEEQYRAINRLTVNITKGIKTPEEAAEQFDKEWEQAALGKSTEEPVQGR